MGRHSTAYIAAQQGLSTRPAAAAYVGRVGALALALGIGAAVAGGTGIANADESGAKDPKPGGGDTSSGAQPSPGSPSADDTTPGPVAENPTAKVRKPGLFNLPKVTFGTRSSIDTDGPASLPGLLAGIPKKIAESLAHESTATPTSTPKKRPKSGTSDGSDKTPPPSAGIDTGFDTDTTASYARALADTATAVRGYVQPPAAVVQQFAPPTTTATTSPVPVTNFAAAISTNPAKTKPALANPVVTVVSGVLSALGIAPSATNPDGTPTAPMPIVLSVLQLVRRELDHITLQLAAPLAATTTAQTNANPAIAPGAPNPTDEVQTAYGDIGKWMLKSNGDIADYGGQKYEGKTLLEPVNVIIVDPKAKSPAHADARLNSAMFWSGFPAQPIHSGGFEGAIDDNIYGQEPGLPLLGYSNNLFIFRNDHGRVFGPDPVETSQGYVWSGAFSTEDFAFVNGLPGHTYVSSNTARNALATALILSGRATYGGVVKMDNAVDNDTTTTGDHDGYAVVLILR